MAHESETPMNRREFSALLPLLVAAPSLAPAAAQTIDAFPYQPLRSGRYPQGEAYGEQRPARTSHRFLIGMLPDNIRLESHLTYLTPALRQNRSSTISTLKCGWFARAQSL